MGVYITIVVIRSRGSGLRPRMELEGSVRVGVSGWVGDLLRQG